MKRSFFSVVIIAALLIVTMALAQSRSAKTDTKNTDRTDSEKIAWEYLVIAGGRVNLSGSGNSSSMSKISLDSSFREQYPLERNLDKLGAEGWELITVVTTQTEPIYYLKRAKEPNK